MNIIDYSDFFEDGEFAGRLIAAHGRGTNFLALTKLDSPVRRLDGHQAEYVVKHMTLRKECGDPKDQAWATVTADENTFWTEEELTELGALKTNSLFSCFTLF